MIKFIMVDNNIMSLLVKYILCTNSNFLKLVFFFNICDKISDIGDEYNIYECEFKKWIININVKQKFYVVEFIIWNMILKTYYIYIYIYIY